MCQLIHEIITINEKIASEFNKSYIIRKGRKLNVN